MLTDSHCHLASHKFPASEVPELVGRARDAGVTRMVTLATCLDDIDANLAIASNHPEVRCCIGIHPCDVHHAPTDVIDLIRPLLGDPRVCAVGETGLDYYHPAPDGWDEETFRNRQRELLDAHFLMAAEAGLNVVIHTRDRSGDASLQDALTIYRRHAERVRAVFHCFISSPDNARSVLDLGGLVSFGGVATFKNATDVLELASTLPADRFMLETDSPYLSPHPHRGERNEPARTRIIAEKIAESRGMELEDLARITRDTACAFFRGIE
ncbi:TatD family protein [Haloferula helveola]|uniref:TatD family protein n=1 Tax=Haloferula helveola TaxID=490095 RepID=A0ABM7RBW9_9BACT|nr:TatD family protein [Haloferula helveola]